MKLLRSFAALLCLLPTLALAGANLPPGLTKSAISSTVAPWDVPGYDIVLLAGQSNMAGRGVYDATIDGILEPRVFQFGGYAAGIYNKTIISGADPLQFPEAIEGGLLGPVPQWRPATWHRPSLALT